MKPLSSLTYLKNNMKKMLPIFFSVAIGVFLIYIFSLFSATTNKMVEVATFAITDKYNIAYTKDDTALPQTFLDELDRCQIQEVFPVQMNLAKLAYYRGGMGSTGLTTFNLFKSDVKSFLDGFGVELIEGSLPQNNQNEILVPVEFALQNNLRIGDYIGTAVSDQYALQGKYRICGLLQGEVLFSVSCQPGDRLREEAAQTGVMYSIEDLDDVKQKRLNEHLTEKVITITKDYYTQEFSTTFSSVQLLTYLLTAIMVIVLCIALGNLNIVLFDNRRSEMTILYSIGFTKRCLAWKMWKENLLVCLGGYLAGIILTMLGVWLLNTLLFIPNGKVLNVISPSGLMSAFTLPVFVSVFSLLPSLISNFKNMKEISY